MAGVTETAVPTGQQKRLGHMTGWRLALLLVSPYLLIQFIHEVAPSLFPNFLSVVNEDSIVPFRDWANRSLLHLKDEDLLGLFNFKDFTRTVSGWLEYPLDVSEQLLIAGDGPFGLSAVPWVALVAGFAVAGAWLGGWRLSVLVGGCSLYLAIFDVWEDSMITLSIVLVVAPLAAVIGWALGLAAAKSRRFEALLIPALNVMQSMPHFSYLLPISVFIGIGDEAGAIATILFAVPPMARLTLLGLQTVPAEVREAGLMAGCTRWQMLWKVEMPAARPQLMVGINQVLMQCFGMTVLASFVGTRGLGLPLLNYLQSLRIGRALEVGVAIVLMAIMLDRLSQAAGSRKPEHTDYTKSWLQRHPFLVAGTAVTVGGVVLGQLFDQAKVLPEKWTVSTAPFWEEIVDWVQLNLKSPLGEFRDFMILEILIPMRNGFESLPWLGLLVLVAMLGWYFGGLRLAAIVSGFIAYLAFSGFWIESMETLYLVVASLIVSVVIGVPVGVYASKTDHRHAAMQVVLDTFQVLPSFIYLIPVVMLFRVGPVAALVAIVIYSTVPAVRYTMLGLRNVPDDVVEAARMSGCTEFQVLRKVRLPMAFPEIMLGMNQVLLFSLLLVIIAAFIGGIEGLGDEILRSRTEQALVGEGLVAGFNVAVIGLTADQLITNYARDRKAQLGIA
ncbi:MAG: ABC transporter permease subunit [Acidimicrobiaceae bacterium]|nr:ABC transporter permease subunit [Acidimicrobiaceae bacterium]MDE0606438.1 ABC transporter permease subunit [Acidimicrobiaceae bacterium]